MQDFPILIDSSAICRIYSTYEYTAVIQHIFGHITKSFTIADLLRPIDSEES